MAALVKNGETFGLIWTDTQRTPRQVRESLKTDERHLALRKKKELEWGYHNRDNPHFPDDQKHDPWIKRWYERRKDTSEGITVPKAIEAFITYKKAARGKEGWGSTTARNESFVLRKFARIIGDKPLADLSKKDLEKIYYRPSVSSDHTRNSDYISMNTFLNWCKEQGYIKTKPEFKPDKPQSKIPKFITPEELHILIGYRLGKIESEINSAAQKKPDHAAYWTVLSWMVLAGTGMRPVELAQIKTDHVGDGYIDVGVDFITKVKAERRVPLLFEAGQAIELLTDPVFRHKEPWMKDSPYLTGRKPEYAKKELSRDFSKTWKECFPKKPKRTLYNLKNTFAVRFLCDDSIDVASGMKLLSLRDILGHTSLETTQIYLQAIPYGAKVIGTIWDYPVRKK